jgi:hypothetical protein
LAPGLAGGIKYGEFQGATRGWRLSSIIFGKQLCQSFYQVGRPRRVESIELWKEMVLQKAQTGFHYFTSHILSGNAFAKANHTRISNHLYHEVFAMGALS